MKIPGSSPLSIVWSKKADDSNEKKKDKKEDPSQKESQEKETQAYELSIQEAELQAAADALRLQGMTAEIYGKGPGLKVTLRDGMGSIVRQISGEEFVRMKEIADATRKGRVLDRKG